MPKKLKSRARLKKLSREPEITSTSLSSQIQHPVFCLHYLSSDYCLTKCDQIERASFADTIRILSQCSWNEIITNRIKGYEKILDKKSINKGYLPSNIPEDASIIGFHFHDKKRVLGWRNAFIFHIVWFDPKFKLYKH